MEAELQKALLFRGTLYRGLDPALLEHLAGAAKQHGLAAKQAAAAFDKFMVSQRIKSTEVSAEDVQAFMAGGGFGRAGPKPLTAARASNLFNRGNFEDLVMGEAGEGGENAEPAGAAHAGTSQRITPYLSKHAPRPASASKPHTPATAGKFAERQNAGAVVASLNAQLEVPAAAEAGSAEEAMEVDGGAPRCAVQVLGHPMRPTDKFLADRLEDKVAYLEGRIVAAEEAAAAALGCEVHPVAAAAQQPSLFVGRVCCDAEGGKLNPQSLLLEGSVRSSGGARVRLDVSRLPAFRLFPGQVLALRGTNPSGFCVVASQLLPGLAAPPAATPLPDLARFAAATGARGTSLVAAAGPFTSAEDLEYAPLAALLDYCSLPGQRPDVLLLLGPFVDAEHAAVRGGLVEEAFEELYASRVLGQIERFTAATGGATRVLLVPSTRDVLALPVVPQPPLVGAAAGVTATPAGCLPLANPSTLALNEVVLGTTSSDWLMACTREETAKAAAGEERLPAMAAHLPAQRSYLPMFPPPLDCPLDCARGATALAMPATPDLLVLPSDLAPFAKLCPVLTPGQAAAPADGEPGAAPVAAAAAQSSGSFVCINPGRLTKGASGGTFAHVHILPLPEAVAVAGGAPAPTNAPVPHQLERRCRVDIKRI